MGQSILGFGVFGFLGFWVFGFLGPLMLILYIKMSPVFCTGDNISDSMENFPELFYIKPNNFGRRRKKGDGIEILC